MIDVGFSQSVLEMREARCRYLWYRNRAAGNPARRGHCACLRDVKRFMRSAPRLLIPIAAASSSSHPTPATNAVQQQRSSSGGADVLWRQFRRSVPAARRTWSTRSCTAPVRAIYRSSSRSSSTSPSARAIGVSIPAALLARADGSHRIEDIFCCSA